MRAIACASTFLLLSSITFVQSGAASELGKDQEVNDSWDCPRTHVLQGKPEEQYWLEGTIGPKKIRMYLHRTGANVVGLFYFTEGEWIPTLLGGEWDSNRIKLSGTSADEASKGSLQGKLVGCAFTGSWAAAASSQTEPVRVAATPRPACDTEGDWKRFDDAK